MTSTSNSQMQKHLQNRKLDRKLREVKLFDLEVFVEVGRTGSLRVTARKMGMEASKVSRCIQGLEKNLEQKLFLRSTTGSLLTPAGQRVLAEAQVLLNQSQFLKSTDPKSPVDYVEILGICTTNYLAENFIPSVIENLRRSEARTRFRILELYPDQMLQPSMHGAFDCALHLDRIEWPSTWDTTTVGTYQWHFCCRKGHPLLNQGKLRIEDLIKYPFITPFDYRVDGAYQFRDDRCPIPWNLRASGEEVQRADVATRIIAKTDQIGFLPEVALLNPVAQGHLKILRPLDTPEVKVPLNLSLQSSRFTVPFKNRIVRAIQENLKALVLEPGN